MTRACRFPGCVETFQPGHAARPPTSLTEQFCPIHRGAPDWYAVRSEIASLLWVTYDPAAEGTEPPDLFWQMADAMVNRFDLAPEGGGG